MCLSSISPLGQFQRTIYNIERPEGGTLEPWIYGRGAKFERGTDLKGRTSELSSYHGNLKKFTPIIYNIRWSLLFDFPGTGIYSSVSNLWDQIYLHLIFQLINSSRDLLLELQMLDNRQLPISVFLTLWRGSAVYQNPSENHSSVSKEIHP